MKKIWMPWFVIFVFLACARPSEFPLVLPAAAEPSAKMHNDQGLAHFEAGRYREALIKFTQASVADSTTGEIHFNIGLAYHQQGEKAKALEHFRLAIKYADGNPEITESPLIKKLLGAAGPS